MSFSQNCAFHFVPLMARIVLGAVFITAGYNKVFQYRDFDAATINRITSGATEAPPVDTTAGAFGRSGWTVQTVAIHRSQDQEPPRLTGGGSGQGIDDTDAALDETQRGNGLRQLGEAGRDALRGLAGDDENQDDPQAEEITQEPAAEPTAAPTVSKRGLYGVAIMLDSAGWEHYVVTLAWLAALTELVGGGLILLGFFSRVWGLGLSCILVVAFYLTSLPALQEHGVDLFLEPQYQQQSSTLFLQLALFVLAFGIFLTGPGAASLDRLLFRSAAEDSVDIDLT